MCWQATAKDQRQLPLSLTNLARLLKRRIPGVFIAEYEEGLWQEVAVEHIFHRKSLVGVSWTRIVQFI
jgi:hypothetical protein